MTAATTEVLTSNDDSAIHKTWVDMKVGQESSIRASNPSFPVPKGLEVVPDFLSRHEATTILNEVDENKWQRGGFTQKILVQSYNCDDESLTSSLASLVDRLEATTQRRPRRVVVEEYPPSVRQTPLESNRVVTTFESIAQCDADQSCDCCFVAQVALLTPAEQHLHRPKERRAECWTLASPDHWTDLEMEPQTLLVKSGESLWDWRSRVTPPPNATDRVVVVKFYNLPDCDDDDNEHESKTTTTDGPRTSLPLPPLEDILTIIVTTSPIRSNPSTEMLQHTFESFSNAGGDFAFKCRKVIVCDGCRVLDDDGDTTKKISRRHSNTKQALRSGIATATQAENYDEFKKNVKSLCEYATPDSPFWNTSVEELQERHGYGFALRHALFHCVKTPYVCVIQHDRTFMRPTPLREALHAMWNHSIVKYIGMSMRSNLMYHDIFRSKYGKTASDDLKGLVLHPPELALDADVYGPEGSSCKELQCLSENARKSTAQLFQTYMKSAQCLEEQEWVSRNPLPAGKHQLTLTPTLFWYDNTHVCETAHYRDFVFDLKYKMVARGAFVEDMSPNIAKSVERLGLAEGHARFGCYLLDDHSGTFFTGHLDGGSYLTKKEKEQFSSNT